MKNICFLIFALLFATPSEANNTFLQNVHDFVMKCAVQPYTKDANGRTVFKPLKSVCRELKVASGGWEAKFRLDGQVYHAALFDSEHSDNGDLNDLVIKQANGQMVVEINNVPAFGDVILALAGGDNDFRKVYEP